MKSYVPSLHRLCLFLLAFIFVGGSGLASAAPGGRKSLELELAADRRSAQVTVPDGVSTVTVQRFGRDGGWQKFATKAAIPGVMKFKLPASGKGARWRAIGRFEVPDIALKFPAKFYRGRSDFGPTKSNGSLLGPMVRINDGLLTDTGFGTGNVAEEADIWKTDGNTVYFFNQLRGLQVLDLSNPADPHLTASLRLPAVGQDLYLLPGSGDRLLVLLTEDWSDKDGQFTRINLVKVSGTKVKIIQTTDLPGGLSDSRLVGNRLILATTEWSTTPDASGDWSSISRLSEWLLTADKAPQKAAETVIEGGNPLIASGPDWLAVAVNPTAEWDVSEVSVFAVRPNGLIRMAAPFRTRGAIPSKFSMNWSGNVFTTVSEKNWSRDTWSPTTILENFRAWAPEVIHTQQLEGPLGKLQLAKGESLYATRFANDKAYVVTFLQTDPLTVVDLSDPHAPVIAGQLEVPGFSTYLEPIGNLLLAIGWDSGTVAASLFDVADPAAPQLLRRVSLGDSSSYSEALWDEKALKVLPDAGLAMIPLTSYDQATGASHSVVQLLDIDVKGGDLKLRGTISHTFEARRADLIGDTVVSISQRVLVAADIVDRDAPEILSEVSLAWPVDHLLDAGDHLVQIEDGNGYGGTATARISPANAPEEILAETDLGEGIVKAADIRGGKLYVLREIAPAQRFYYYITSPVIGKSTGNKVILDIYDASALPALSVLGSCSVSSPSGARVGIDHLLWPQPNRPAVVVDFRYSYWFGWNIAATVKVSETFAAAAAPLRVGSDLVVNPWPYQSKHKAPRLILFDTTHAEAPQAGEPVALGPEGSSFTGASKAADGLAVLGVSYAENSNAGDGQFQAARVIEVAESGTPIVRPLIELPGELFAVTELDSNGFLAFTRNDGDEKTSIIHVSASNGYTAFQITSVSAPAYGAVTAGGRRLFIADTNGVQRFHLNTDGEFDSEPFLKTGWQPDSLRWIQGRLIGSSGASLFMADETADSLKKWSFATWYLWLDRATLATDGDLLMPFGDYGAERLSP